MSLPTASNGVVVCIATGPSLTAADVDYCRGKATVICVNDAWKLAPWADVLYSSDKTWWRHHKGVPEFKGAKVGIATMEHGKKQPLFNVTILNNTGKAGLETSTLGLRTARNSGGAAINLAAHLLRDYAGAKQIILLGYDMGRGNDGKAHFFGNHPQFMQKHSPFKDFIQLIGTMAEPLKKLGIRVVNCSRSTQLQCFERGVITDVLQAQPEAVAC